MVRARLVALTLSKHFVSSGSNKSNLLSIQQENIKGRKTGGLNLLALKVSPSMTVQGPSQTSQLSAAEHMGEPAGTEPYTIWGVVQVSRLLFGHTRVPRFLMFLYSQIRGVGAFFLNRRQETEKLQG
jgi:hypothetical protein